MVRVDWKVRWRLCRQGGNRLLSVLRKRGERSIGHGIGEQLLEPSGHRGHGQRHHVQPDFELIVIVRPHDSDNGGGIGMVGKNRLCSKFGNGGVQPAALSRNVQKSRKVRQAGMRGAAVDCSYAGLDGLEFIQGFPGKAGQIDSNRCRRQSMRRSQSAGRYEEGEWVRGI